MQYAALLLLNGIFLDLMSFYRSTDKYRLSPRLMNYKDKPLAGHIVFKGKIHIFL